MIYVKRNNSEFAESDVKLVSEKFNFSELISRLLLSRGYDIDEIDRLINDKTELFPPNNAIPNIEIAAQRIEEAVMSGEKIAVFGDYDADGICGTSIIINSFKSFGYEDVSYYIPNRISEGYGLNNFAIDQINERGCTLIITVDCGISNVKEAEYASLLGIDLIITDHHLPGEILPDAVIVNPKLSDDERLQSLCGAAVALRLMCEVFDEALYHENCDLAAIATVADMVDLKKGENRYIVKTGLSKINLKDNNNIEALIGECVKSKKTIKADDLSYFVAPTINAAGRLDQADKCVELFTGKSADSHETAAILAHDNFNRRKIEKEAFDSAVEKIKDMDISAQRAIILFDESWHQGVLGIAASKIKNIYFRPVILFTRNEGELVGSARSVDGINIHEAIAHCEEYVSHFGGHFMAAGLSLSAENFDSFKNKFEEFLNDVDNSLFTPKIKYDIEVSLDEMGINLLKEIERLEPFGKGNPAPLFRINDIAVTGYLKMGSDNNHFRCKIKSGKNEVPAVAFSNSINLYDDISYDAVVSPQINEWNGKSSVQLLLRDIKPRIEGIAWENIIRKRKSFFELSASQAYYAGNTIEFKPSNYNELCNSLEKRFFSVLMLAVDIASAIKIKETLGKTFEFLDVRFGSVEEKKVNYNTLVIAPDIELLSLDEYKDIYIISEYDICSMYKSLQVNGNVYIISDYKTMDKNKPELSIERLREIYLILKKAILDKSILSAINNSSALKPAEARTALRIFKEAGLIEYDLLNEEFTLTDKKKTDIAQSGTFKNIQSGD